jgi:hypothetical protein
METRLAYCSACDREVRVVVKPGLEPGPAAAENAAAVVCLEYGDACTGSMCPLFEIPSTTMRENLEQTKKPD